MTETSSTCSSRITRSRTRSALSLRNSRVSEKNLLSISKDSHFKPHFSPNGTLSSRRANRQPRENSLKLRCFPRNLALRSVRFASIRTLARAQAEPTHRLWPKPVRVCVSSRVKQFEPPRRRARWRLSRQPQMREDALDHREQPVRLQFRPAANSKTAPFSLNNVQFLSRFASSVRRNDVLTIS